MQRHLPFMVPLAANISQLSTKAPGLILPGIGSTCRTRMNANVFVPSHLNCITPPIH
uniref:Uncharacterized protein n=1 Tax=Ascaris lumbricoides TaxID=6252 RepID=A0A0M3I408_ASCLU